MGPLAAEQQAEASVPMSVTIIVLVIAGIIFTLGYRIAVNRRANDDYKKTKAAVPLLRKGFWSTWWAAVKIGFGVCIVLAILVYWGVSDVRDQDRPRQPVPAQVSKSPANRR